MDSRKILEIYKLINDRSPTLVSAWPSVADIPPGMLVLDADGVVKQKRRVFRNEGADYIDFGRPAAWVALFDSTRRYSVYAVANLSIIGNQSVLFGNDADDFSARTVLRINNAIGDYKFYGQVGGNVSAATSPRYSGGFVRVGLQALGATFNVIHPDGSKSVSVNCGSGVSVGNFRASSSSFEGDLVFVGIYDANGMLVDAFDSNRLDLWDGGTSGYTVMGNPFTVVKGTPFTEEAYSLVPVSML